MPTIVAELSCNHLGRLDRAIALIEAAKGAGADAVKLQCWHPDHMVVDRGYTIPNGPWAGRGLYDLYQEAFTPWEWFPILQDRANAIGIELFASVFDTEALHFLETLHFPRYKIASFEITDLPLIRAVAATGKPLVVSTGMATGQEIEDVFYATEETGVSITLLKCTSAYPAPASAANLATLADFHLYTDQVGLSDHTLGTTVAVAATALGAQMIEKHLTLSRSDGGPDAEFSAEPHEFRALVDACRDAAEAIGTVTFGPTEAERTSLQYRRSLYAIGTIGRGQEFTQNVIDTCVRSARPAQGLHPDYPLLGKRATRMIEPGEPITEADIAH
jgi:N-acetylneuraminate synthase